MGYAYQFLFFLSYASIMSAACVGIVKYKNLEDAMRLIVILLVIASVHEMISYIASATKKYEFRYVTFHLYNIFEDVLIGGYFIYAIKPLAYRKLLIANIIFWPLMGVINIIFLQPLNTLNTNMLMLESFSFITLSLYFIYRILKNDLVENIFHYSHFWMCILWLVLYSSSLFFWAFVKILYRGHWKYIQTAMHCETIINAIVYAGIAIVLYYSGKKMKINGKH